MRSAPKTLRDPDGKAKPFLTSGGEPDPTSLVTARVLWLARGCRGIRLVLLLNSRSASRIGSRERSDTS